MRGALTFFIAILVCVTFPAFVPDAQFEEDSNPQIENVSEITSVDSYNEVVKPLETDGEQILTSEEGSSSEVMYHTAPEKSERLKMERRERPITYRSPDMDGMYPYVEPIRKTDRIPRRE